MTISVKDGSGSTVVVKTIDDLAADGGQVTIGAKADAKSAATDATPISAMSVLKQVSASIQAAAASLTGTLTVGTHAVTGSGNFASTVSDGASVTLGAKADAANTATDTTAVSAISVLKQVSKSVQALVANVGTLATNYGQVSSRIVAAATTNAANLKSTGGNITQIDLFNVAAYDVFVKFYNKASSPTVGTDTPTWTIPIKAGTGYSRAFPQGRWFSTGISLAITKLQADSDTTALAASDVTGSIDWI